MRVAAGALLMVVLTGCSPVPQDTGIGAQRAIEIARSHVGQPAVLVSADLGSSAGWAAPDESPRPAWIVRFTGSWSMPCPAVEAPPTPHCSDLHRATVALDASTGAYISTRYDQ